jgi:hypothetical protein
MSILGPAAVTSILFNMASSTKGSITTSISSFSKFEWYSLKTERLQPLLNRLRHDRVNDFIEIRDH